MDKVSVAVV